MEQVLVTGGTGYIGSITAVQLLKQNYNIIIIDNLSNSKNDVIDKIKTISNVDVIYYNIDITNQEDLLKIFSEHNITSVVHFAAKKSVKESIELPLDYQDINICGTLNILNCMHKFNCQIIIYSSSATVYGQHTDNKSVEENDWPSLDNMCSGPINPYGHSKNMCEQILNDVCKSDMYNIRAVILRQFNPVGAHSSGLLGENPNGIPTNLFPILQQVTIGKIKKLQVFGNDYATRDGTCIRDYIHVEDLAIAHVLSLDYIKIVKDKKLIQNIGTGKGTTTLEAISAFEKESGRQIEQDFVDRRPGDVAILVCNPAKAEIDLKFKAKFTIEDMVRDSWNFETFKNDN